ncbi:MAG TPA: diaminobutyrate--2-oxoglutarate transaminase [Kofleriaceae bacterium]|jgi:diaminobutyrate-2-oxoglutarate transaminase|nr:diaminobutyrate--2-oxoglutarate transaminase [Kofleriaceae bacterium]
MPAIARTIAAPAPRPDTGALESGVRYYSRIFPARIRSAEGAVVRDINGREWVDFFAGAGALNYGHNHPEMRARVIAYLESNGIVHSLDMDTEARSEFLHRFDEVVLAPRHLSYRLQFTGPTGTNCVEAALKLARKVTGRSTVAAFTGAFHGVSLGALAVTASATKRHALRGALHDVVRLPFEGFLGGGDGELQWIDAMLCARGAGVDAPAAFIFECVQGEGGLNVATRAWAQRVCQIARSLGALIIVDEVQTGCGRTGDFFAFEALGIEPDMICLSKSLSGMGIPLAALLVRPELDVWAPGEHNGTFRGTNLAFVAGTTALELWSSPEFIALVERNRTTLRDQLAKIARELGPEVCMVRGRGMLLGLGFSDPRIAHAVRQLAFAGGLLLENCGPDDDVCKAAPPLNIAAESLERGLGILERAVRAAVAEHA